MTRMACVCNTDERDLAGSTRKRPLSCERGRRGLSRGHDPSGFREQEPPSPVLKGCACGRADDTFRGQTALGDCRLRRARAGGVPGVEAKRAARAGACPSVAACAASGGGARHSAACAETSAGRARDPARKARRDPSRSQPGSRRARGNRPRWGDECRHPGCRADLLARQQRLVHDDQPRRRVPLCAAGDRDVPARLDRSPRLRFVRGRFRQQPRLVHEHGRERHFRRRPSPDPGRQGPPPASWPPQEQ